MGRGLFPPRRSSSSRCTSNGIRTIRARPTGRNLLGRAYLDAGQPREAAPWFLQNYQADKNAARAGDSLLYLAEAMRALGDTSRACIALAEFGDTYPALAAGRLSDQYQRNLARVDCD